jgi:hypothetical protein
MPINLRYDLRLRFDRTLALRLEAAWRKIDQIGEAAVKPTWWDGFHANRMRRSFIRHRVMYRIKARMHVAARALQALEPEVLILLPVYALLWLIWRPSPGPSEIFGEYEAFLLRCEIEDLQDEIQRRLHKRKPRQTPGIDDSLRP